MSTIQKVEVVVPTHVGLPKSEGIVKSLAALLFALPLKTLLVFWFMASWFPELGLTFWQLLLPVYLTSIMFQPLLPFKGRWIPSRRLFKHRTTVVDYDADKVYSEDTLTELPEAPKSLNL